MKRYISILFVILLLHGCAGMSADRPAGHSEYTASIAQLKALRKQVFLLTQQLQQTQREVYALIDLKETLAKNIDHLSPFPALQRKSTQEMALAGSTGMTPTFYRSPSIDARLASLSQRINEKKRIAIKTQQKIDHLSPQLTKRQAIAKATSSDVVTIQPARVIYDVVYVYQDKKSRDKFNERLRASGFTDIASFNNTEKAEYYIYVGRFHEKRHAIARRNDLNKKTGSNHLQIKVNYIG
ncbi:MAG: hypothetical protein V3T17_02875 [Pseudomonadales bacterium]